MNPTVARVLIPLAVNFAALAVQTFIEVMICGQGVPQPRPERRSRRGTYCPEPKFIRIS